MAPSHFNQPVELQPAFVWHCHDCGEECFVRAPSMELTKSEAEELRDEHGVQPWESGNFTQIPDVVECTGCKARFQTEHFCNDCE